MTIKTISQLIKFIDEQNITDPSIINEMCENMFSKKFCPLQISGTSYSKYFYLHHLRDFARDFDRNIIERPFINTPYPFSIKDIFN